MSRFTAWAFVILQVILMIVIATAPYDPGIDMPTVVRVIGYSVVGVGLAIVLAAVFGLDDALSPLPTPREGGALVTCGMYRHVRHPIYSGALLAGIGFVVATGSLWRLIALVLLAVLFTVKARLEERELCATYPAYDDYARRTPRFIPSIKPRV